VGDKRANGGDGESVDTQKNLDHVLKDNKMEVSLLGCVVQTLRIHPP